MARLPARAAEHDLQWRVRLHVYGEDAHGDMNEFMAQAKALFYSRVFDDKYVHYKVLPLMPRHIIATPLIWLSLVGHIATFSKKIVAICAYNSTD